MSTVVAPLRSECFGGGWEQVGWEIEFTSKRETVWMFGSDLLFSFFSMP